MHTQSSKNCMNLQQQGWVIIWQPCKVVYAIVTLSPEQRVSLKLLGRDNFMRVYVQEYYKCVIPIMWSIHISCSPQINVETFFYTHVTVASACTVEPASAVTWIRRSPLLCGQMGKVPNYVARSDYAIVTELAPKWSSFILWDELHIVGDPPYRFGVIQLWGWL